MNVLVFFSALLLSCSVELAHSFSSTSLRNQYRCALHRKSVARTVAVFLPQQTVTTSLYLSKDREYSREIRLREEAESPFRKVRFFLYAAILGGAFTSLAVSIARIAAGLSGVNTGLLEESTTNAAIDIGGIALFGFLFKRDADAQESRLKRAAKGAEFAKLAIRGSPALLDGAEGAASGQLAGKTAVTATLSSLRRGRGVDKRVVIAAAGKDTIREVLEEARSGGTVSIE